MEPKPGENKPKEPKTYKQQRWEMLDKTNAPEADYVTPNVKQGESPSEISPEREKEPMYEEALRAISEMGKASTSTLQRRLRLGYGRAARILDMMEKDGIIGPSEGAKPRKILLTPEEIEKFIEKKGESEVSADNQVKKVYYTDGKLLSETFPDGTKKLYDPKGKLSSETFPDGSMRSYEKDGTIILYNKDGNEESRFNLGEKEIAEEAAPNHTEMTKEPETKIFSTKFIEEGIREILEKEDAVKEVLRVQILPFPDENRFTLLIRLKAEKFFIKTDVILSAYVINKENSITLEEGYKITATRAEEKINAIFAKDLNLIGEKIKAHIEGIENRRIKKIEIENGKLKVIFEMPKATLAEWAQRAEPNPELEEAIKRTKTEAIAKLRETIESATKKLKESKAEREKDIILVETLRKELEELRKEKHVNVPKPDKNAEKTEKITDLEAKLLALKSELNNVSRFKSGKRKELTERISELEKTIERMKKEKQSEENKKLIEKDREENPFKYFLLDTLSPKTFQVMFEENRENVPLEIINDLMGEDGKELTFWDTQSITPERDEVVTFSSNGFYLKLKNEEEVRSEKGIKVDDLGAKYDLIGPDGVVVDTDVDYQIGQDLLQKKAGGYFQHQVDAFSDQMELKELESIPTIEEKKEFLERKRKERINNIEEIKFTIEYSTKNLKSEYTWEKEQAEKDLEAINNSPLDFYVAELAISQRAEERAGEEGYDEAFYKRYIEKYQKVIDQIKTINDRYDTLLANLEKGDN